jgi:hypothetical protein
MIRHLGDKGRNRLSETGCRGRGRGRDRQLERSGRDIELERERERTRDGGVEQRERKTFGGGWRREER